METADRIQIMADRIATQLRVKSGGMQDVVERAGRKLPNRLSNELQTLLEAEVISSNPKLHWQIDEKKLKRAERRVNAFLDTQNPMLARWGDVLDFVAKVAFVFVLVVLSVFFYLLNTGYFD
ncbi:MAG: hypothetical protein GKR98_06710 [Boseongicola sp.]|nr:MAG: hypothetical protein GKR98_06710 [Boseongicola sp.]